MESSFQTQFGGGWLPEPARTNIKAGIDGGYYGK